MAAPLRELREPSKLNILEAETLARRHSLPSPLRPEQREILLWKFKSPVILSVVEL
jgi:hypothetical protein